MASLVKKSAGELLVIEIEKAMLDRDLSVEAVAKQAKMGTTTLYKYMRMPGSIPLARLVRLARVVGLKEITILAGGTYRERQYKN